MKVNRLMSIVLFACFSVFLGHNLVPHHHHTEVLNTPVSTEFPLNHADHHDNNESEDHPIQCYAFNDIVINKYSTPGKYSFARVATTLMANVLSLNPEPLPVMDFSRYTLKIPDKSFEYFGARSLRAPPVSV